MRSVFNPCRIFAVNDEKGIIICEWPTGSYKPQIPLPYTEECMTGFEYAAAGLMLQEGLLKEGNECISAIRERYDGRKRNPYSEIECGASYARSMAAFALPAIYSGFRFDMPHGRIGFRPLIPDRPFTAFWSVDDAWGSVCVEKDGITLRLLYGKLSLRGFFLPDEARATGVTADGKELRFTQDGDTLCFEKRTELIDCLIIRF